MGILHVESKEIAEVFRFAMAHAENRLDLPFMETIGAALEEIIRLQK